MSRHPGRIRLDGQRCVEARRRRGLSRAALVELTEPNFPISEATVKRAEKGHSINLEKAGTLARLLGVELVDLLPESAPERIESSSISGVADALPSLAPVGEGIIGREHECSLLREAMAAAERGRPTILFIEGEAGIGKTRLMQEARALCAQAGGVVCAGRAFETAGHPFQPFVEALSGRVQRLAPLEVDEAAAIDSLLHPAADSGASGRDPAESSSGHEPMFRAVARALIDARRPTLLLLDDLHWADPGTIRLLERVTSAALANVARGRPCSLIVLLGQRTEAASARVEELLRGLQAEPDCTRIRLEGLDEAGLFDLVRRFGIDRPSPALISMLARTTRGNPLFVKELVEVLRMRGDLFERGGYVGTSLSESDLELPDSVQAAILSRIEQLGRDCRRALVRAAFLGGDFELPMLAAVLEEDEDELLEQLEEAVSEGYLENQEQRFGFVHPLVRHVLYRVPIPARRQRYHREIAERLEQYYAPIDDHRACEIADHWIRAGSVAPDERLMRTTRTAVDHSMRRHAWDAAAGYLEALLKEGGRRALLSDAEAAELHRLTGVAQHRCWNAGASLEHYDLAIASFERIADLDGLARALNDRVRLATNLGLRDELAVRQRARLESVLDRLGPARAVLRGQILDTLASADWVDREYDRAMVRAEEALAIGEDEGDEDLCAQVSTSLALAHMSRLDLPAARDRWQRGVGHAESGGDPLRKARCLQRIPLALLGLGEVGSAFEAARVGFEASLHVPNPGESSLPCYVEAACQAMRGNLAEAGRAVDRTLGLVRRFGFAAAGTAAYPLRVYLHALSGERAEAEAAIDEFVTPGVVFEDPTHLSSRAARLRDWVTAFLGSPAECAALEQRLASTESTARDEAPDFWSLDQLCLKVEVAARLGIPPRAEAATEAIAAAHARGVRISNGWPIALGRALGVGLTVLGRYAEAEARLAEAEAWASAEGARLELARTRLDHARLLVARDGTAAKPAAMQLAEAAREALPEMLGLDHGLLARQSVDLT